MVGGSSGGGSGGVDQVGTDHVGGGVGGGEVGAERACPSLTLTGRQHSGSLPIEAQGPGDGKTDPGILDMSRPKPVEP